MRRQVVRWITIAGVFALGAGVCGTVYSELKGVHVPMAITWCIRGGVIATVLAWFIHGFGKEKVSL